MNPYIYRAACFICGGEVISRNSDVGWTYQPQHRYIETCMENLRCERAKVERTKKVEQKKE